MAHPPPSRHNHGNIPAAYAREFEPNRAAANSSQQAGNNRWQWLLWLGLGLPMALVIAVIGLEALRGPFSMEPNAEVGAYYSSAYEYSELDRYRANAEAELTAKLRQIWQALQSYHDLHGHYPPEYSVDSNGDVLHSWQTLLLPHFENLELQRLAESIDYEEPWNAEANKDAYDRASSYYLLNANYDTMFAPDIVWTRGGNRGLAQDELDDSSVLVVVFQRDAERSGHWMQPQTKNAIWKAEILRRAETLGVTSNTPGILYADGTILGSFQNGPIIAETGDDEAPEPTNRP
jgi:hypothetical protein